MKKRLMVLGLILTMAISFGGMSWATGEGLEDMGIEENSFALEIEKPVFVDIVRPLGEVVTDTNLFISARIFDGYKAKMSVYKIMSPVNFSSELNLVGIVALAVPPEELVFESGWIERKDESVFYYEETEDGAVEEAPQGEPAEGILPDPESTEETLLIERLNAVFSSTTESGLDSMDEKAERDVLFYYKRLENIAPGNYRIEFKAYGDGEEAVGSVEKSVAVKDISTMIKSEEEIKREVLNILSRSFIGIVSR